MLDLAEIEAQITELRQMAEKTTPEEAESLYWMANELEARARAIHATA